VLSRFICSVRQLATAGIPAVRVQSTKNFREGHIVTIEPVRFIRTIFRPESPTTPFSRQTDATVPDQRSQPPKEVDDSYLVGENPKMLSLIQHHHNTWALRG
jgi:hypothetical protein